MTEICDCHNSDKAYAIINPDSPDRKEILSLNPPICRQTKDSPEKLFLNGQIVENQKELTLENPYTIKTLKGCGTVDFRLVYGNPTSIFNLSATAPPEATMAFISTAREPRWVFSNCRFRSGVNLVYLEFDTDDSRPVVNTSGNKFSYVPNCYFGSVNSCYAQHSYWQRYNTMNRKGIGATSRPVISVEIVDFREGQSTCELVLNHKEGSTLNYGEIPCNSKITTEGKPFLRIFDQSGNLHTIFPFNNQEVKIQCGDRQCPPETCCNPCEGKALNCCYDENGKLIDSFIRRT